MNAEKQNGASTLSSPLQPKRSPIAGNPKKRKIDHHLSLDGLDRVHKKLQPPAKKIRLELDVWNEKNGNK